MKTHLKNSMSTTVLAVIAILMMGVNSVHAFNPYWSMEGSTIAGGSHYSKQSGLSATHPVALESNTSDDWSAVVTLLNGGAAIEIANVEDATDNIDVLFEDVGEEGLTLNRVSELQSQTNNILQQFDDLGTIISLAAIGSGGLPTIAVTHPKLKGTVTFQYQANLVNSVPSAYALSFDADPLRVIASSGVSSGGNEVNVNQLDACAAALDNASSSYDVIRTACASVTDDVTTAVNDCASRSTEQAQIQCLQDELDTLNEFSIESGSAANIRLASKFTNFNFGYSRQIWQREDGNSWKAGKVFAGVRVSVTDVETVSESIILTNNNEDLNKRLESLIDGTASSEKSGGIGLDAGATWLSSNYMAGLVLHNILAPTIKYSAGGDVKQNIVPTLEAAYYLNDSHTWQARLQNDFAAMKDLVGVEHQWRVLGLSYTSDSYLVPGFEISKRWNQAGNKLSYTGLGLKLFNILQFNLALSDQRVGSAPRGLIANLSLGFSL